jgi:hypothetical protein
MKGPDRLWGEIKNAVKKSWGTPKRLKCQWNQFFIFTGCKRRSECLL